MLGNNGYLGRSPSDSTVIVARQVYQPTAPQTVFDFAAKYQPGYFDVYLNGTKLVTGIDYNATDGSKFSLVVSCIAGDVIETMAYKAFNIGNIREALGNFTVGGDVAVTGSLNVVEDLEVLGVTTISGISTTFISAVGIASEGVQVGQGITNINFVGTGNTFSVNGGTVDVRIEGGAGVGTAIKYRSGVRTPFSYIDATTKITEDIVLDANNAGANASYVVVQEPTIIVATGVGMTVGLGKTLVTDLYQLGDL